ncbi:MAG: HlyD family efflux transporter periplasmic adaptor subunit [Burkholderiaceae bacterium]
MAPFDGRVLSQNVHAGDTVQPGRELARIFDDNALEVTVPLSDRDIAMVDNPWREAGARPTDARVEIEHGGQRYAWPARVDRVEAAVDATTRTFNMVVRVIEPRAPGEPVGPAPGSAPTRRGPPLLVGMFAQVEIAGRDQGRFFTLARNALRDGDQLWLVTPQDTIDIRPVRVLGERGDRVAIAAEPGSEHWRIVTSDLRIVTPGMAVRPLPEADLAPTDKLRQSSGARPTLAAGRP